MQVGFLPQSQHDDGANPRGQYEIAHSGEHPEGEHEESAASVVPSTSAPVQRLGDEIGNQHQSRSSGQQHRCGRRPPLEQSKPGETTQNPQYEKGAHAGKPGMRPGW